MPIKFITATKARKNFFQIIEAVQDQKTRYILTINGKPEAIIMSVEEYEAIKANLKKLSAANTKGSKKIKWDPESFFGGSSELILREEPAKKYKVRKRSKTSKSR